jgi:hypothetical protein
LGVNTAAMMAASESFANTSSLLSLFMRTPLWGKF